MESTEPTFVNEAERTVWNALKERLPEGWRLIPNLRLTDARKDHEADIVVLAPDLGVLVLETKGGSIWHDGRYWLQGRKHKSRRIRPVDQARGAAYALRDYVEADPRWRGSARARVLFTYAVVFPHTIVDGDFARTDCPRWKVNDRDDIGVLVPRLVDLMDRERAKNQRPPTSDDCALIAEIVQGRALPVRDVIAEALEHEARAERLTSEQAALLKVTRLLNRVEIRGAAGSGKTVLALTQARELAAGGEVVSAQRVALLCYSIGLATHLKRVTAAWPRRKQPAFVGTFADLGEYLGVETLADRDDSDFWERGLPAEMAQRAADLAHGRRFDAVVVDEAQDFADDWWTPLLGVLRDPDQGGLYVYSDEHQRVFARFGRPSVALVPLVLDRNLRNTRQIAGTFRPLAPAGMRLGDYDGPHAGLVECATEDAVGVADDQVDTLLEEGWRPQDIALLTTGRRHPEQVAQQERVGQAGYWESFWDDDLVFYGHVLGCKGLERRVVVLAVNEKEQQERARERLYVGLSRATERLVVVGSAELIGQIGGEPVLQALTRAPRSGRLL